MPIMWSLLGVFIFTLLQTFTLAINEDSAKESPCFNITNAVDPDAKWFSSVEKWYYPLASRLDLYRSVHDLLAMDYKNIPEYSLYYDACLEWGINDKGFTLNGYNRRTRFLGTTTVGPGTSDFKSEWSQGMVGRAYTTLTDNKTFAFTAACFADNQMSWNVFATTKTLNRATRQKIFEHAMSLGYNPDYFTEMRYDSCKRKYDDADINRKRNNLYSTEPGNRPVEDEPLACNVCKKACPSLFAKADFTNKYYKKLYKTNRDNNIL